MDFGFTKKTKELLFTLKKIPFRAGLLDGYKKTKRKNFEIFVKSENIKISLLFG